MTIWIHSLHGRNSFLRELPGRHRLTGREALERLRNSPDLRQLILDLLTTDLNDIQFLELARLPVIAVSGFEQRVDVQVQLRNPVNFEHLLKQVETIPGGKRHHERTGSLIRGPTAEPRGIQRFNLRP